MFNDLQGKDSGGKTMTHDEDDFLNVHNQTVRNVFSLLGVTYPSRQLLLSTCLLAMFSSTVYFTLHT